MPEPCATPWPSEATKVETAINGNCRSGNDCKQRAAEGSYHVRHLASRDEPACRCRLDRAVDERWVELGDVGRTLNDLPWGDGVHRHLRPKLDGELLREEDQRVRGRVFRTIVYPDGLAAIGCRGVACRQTEPTRARLMVEPPPVRGIDGSADPLRECRCQRPSNCSQRIRLAGTPSLLKPSASACIMGGGPHM